MPYSSGSSSPQPIQNYSAAGTKRLMVQTGLGWLILSRLPLAAVEAIYRKTIDAGELTEREFSFEELRQRVMPLREQDYIVSRARNYVRPTAHWDGGMISILAPTPPGHRTLGLGVSGPATRLERNQAAIVGELRAEATRLAVETTSPDTSTQRSPDKDFL